MSSKWTEGKDVKGRFIIEIEGDSVAVLGPFDHNSDVYDQLLMSRTAVDDEEPNSDCFFSVEVKTTEEMYKVMKLLADVKCGINLRYLLVGDPVRIDSLMCSGSYSSIFNQNQAIEKIYIDEETINTKLGERILKAKKILNGQDEDE